MNCKKCQKVIPAESLYCNWCGAKQIVQTRKKRKRPNGSGTVNKLSGKREKPFAAFAPGSGLGKGRYIGTFKTETEALLAIAKIGDAALTDTFNFTLKQYYNKWSIPHFAQLGKDGIQGYKCAWNFLSPIQNKKMRDIKTFDFQICIDEISIKYSRSQCEKVKQLCSQLCKCAMQDDVINKNYAEFIKLPKEMKKEKIIFTEDEIKKLFDHKDDKRAQVILTLIYTGFRISELFGILKSNVNLEQRFLIGGLKTEAGKNRIVPISDKIYPFIKNWYDASDNEFLLKKDSHNFRNREFYPALVQYGILGSESDHRITPHSCRHTFASLCSDAGVKAESLQKIIGHAKYSTTAEIYIHTDASLLKQEIDKL